MGYALVTLDPARADAAFGAHSLPGFLASYAIGFRAASSFKIQDPRGAAPWPGSGQGSGSPPRPPP